MTIEEKAKAYDEAIEKAQLTIDTMDYEKKQRLIALRNRMKEYGYTDGVEELESIFPQLAESEDEKIREWCISHFKECFRASKDNLEYRQYLNDKIIPWLEKQKENLQNKSAIELWKDMRLEVYQQASGNRHEPNYSDDTTKMFSLTDIDEVVEEEFNNIWDSDLSGERDTAVAKKIARHFFEFGAERMAEQGVKATASVGYYNQCGLSILTEPSIKKLGFKEGDEVEIVIRKK